MSSRFVNLFKSSDGDELRAFQSRVLGIMKEVFPNKNSSADDDPSQIKVDESTCGLTNIHSEFLLSDGTDETLKELVRQRFEAIDESGLLSDRAEMNWEAAQGIVMPQLMPREFLTKIPLANDEFFDQIVIGFAIDTETAYSYISLEDIEEWGVTIDDVRIAAYDNLTEKSQGLAMNAFPRPNGFVVINSMDGFDAVRITSPEMRAFVGEFLGTPFYFGIPNRDFLICWEDSGDADFHTNFVNQIAQDSQERPYPLSGRPFRVNEDGEIEPVEPEVDPRAETASLN